MLIFSHPLLFCDTCDFSDLSIHAYINTYIYKYIYRSSRDTENKLNSHFSKFSIYMLFEETDTEESGNSDSDVSSLDNVFSRMQFESSSSEEQVTDDRDDLMWIHMSGVK